MINLCNQIKSKATVKVLPYPETFTSPMTLLIFPRSFLMQVDLSTDDIMPSVLPSVTSTPSINFCAIPPLLSNVIVFKSSQNLGISRLALGNYGMSNKLTGKIS